ncbi:hypothetical protein [Streptomyces sp. PSKA30]|uniref:hypothetical protein n=1 Tax=Streptomyces sp. PSKA30 TaxID=2874597 RepID=UPI001CD15798|nr:hypothetical protein [Streptomyces sp. PSKA30]MBZ9641457.1 hypothetical protein [Streptomyces sp. PSKA30]
MSEIDERRINELVQQPSPLLRGGAGAAARAEARKVLEWQAGIRRREPGDGEEDGDW